MIDHGRHNILGVMVDAVDEEEAVRRIMAAADGPTPFAGTALAVHGVMTGEQDPEHRSRLNQLDLVVPDGQPVRWALNRLYGTDLHERVYGPDLMLAVCKAAEARRYGIYLYGSTRDVLETLVERLNGRFPNLIISGAEPSAFRRLSAEEKVATATRIRESGARITFVGLGCPRQEVWAYEYREALGMPVLAVGAAFDFHAGTTPEAPAWLQKRGLEWLFRLMVDPRRLWKRYILLNPQYVAFVAMQALHLRRFEPITTLPIHRLSYG
jgi:exopolysaccharide biosynthesis WecB/TagA/CpsF family protein